MHKTVVAAQRGEVVVRCTCAEELARAASFTPFEIEMAARDHEGRLAAKEWTGARVQVAPSGGRYAGKTGTVTGSWERDSVLMRVEWDDKSTNKKGHLNWHPGPIHHGHLVRLDDAASPL